MIHEVIVTTVDINNKVHIAPMGIRWKNNDSTTKKIIVSPFKPSKTLGNLITSEKAVINFIDDVRVFAGIVTKEKQDWDIDLTNPHYPYLVNTNTYISAKVIDIEEDDIRPNITCEQVNTKIIRPFMGFNRAQNAVIEGAVLTSRLGMIEDEKIQNEIKYLKIAIDKTAGSRELEAWKWIMLKINDHFKK